jgi:hypothetical protein
MDTVAQTSDHFILGSAGSGVCCISCRIPEQHSDPNSLHGASPHGVLVVPCLGFKVIDMSLPHSPMHASHPYPPAAPSCLFLDPFKPFQLQAWRLVGRLGASHSAFGFAQRSLIAETKLLGCLCNHSELLLHNRPLVLWN